MYCKLISTNLPLLVNANPDDTSNTKNVHKWIRFGRGPFTTLTRQNTAISVSSNTGTIERLSSSQSRVVPALLPSHRPSLISKLRFKIFLLSHLVTCTWNSLLGVATCTLHTTTFYGPFISLIWLPWKKTFSRPHIFLQLKNEDIHPWVWSRARSLFQHLVIPDERVTRFPF